MDLQKLASLKKGSKLRINNLSLVVVEVDGGIRPSKVVKEYLLLASNKQEYLLQIVNSSSVSFWRIENDTVTGKPFFGENNLLEIESIEL